MVYLVEFIAGFLATWSWCQRLRKGRVRAVFLDTPNARSSHRQPIPRGGGALFFLAVIGGLHITLWQHAQPPTLQTHLLTAAFLVVAAVGIFDDLKPLPARTRLFFQSMGALCLALSALLYFPDMNLHPFWSILFMVAGGIVTLSLVNFFNFADGINGYVALTALLGIAVILSFQFFFRPLAILNNLPTWFNAIALLIGSLVAFLYENLIRGQVFMGDGGSTTLGIFFSSLFYTFFISLTDQSNALGYIDFTSFWLNFILSLLLIIGLCPWIFCDCAAMVVAKKLCNVPLAKSHNQHFYQRLSRRKNFTHKRTALMLTGTQLVFSLTIFGSYGFLGSEFTVRYFCCIYIMMLIALVFYHRRNLRSENIQAL